MRQKTAYTGERKVMWLATVATLLVGGVLAVSEGVSATSSCPGGGTATNLVSGLDAISGGSVLDRTSPANLVVNGDFTIEPTGLSTSGSPDRYYWGSGGLTVKNGVTATNSAIPFWSTSGGTASTYAFWSKSLTGNSNTLVAPAANGQSAGRLYFGNGVTSAISPYPRFGSTGLLVDTFTVTPGGAYGTFESPPSINQTITLVTGQQYRMSFGQSTEAMLDYSGIAALEITGYGRVYFEVVPGNKGYMVEFVATSNDTNIKFMQWGHIGGGNGRSNFVDIVSRSSTSSVVTLTTSTAHGYTVGQTVAISGVGARYDTTLVSIYQVPNSTSFTYILGGTSEGNTTSSGYAYRPQYGLSAELVLDDVIINACNAAGIPSTTIGSTTPVSPATTVTASTPGSSTTTVITGVTTTVPSSLKSGPSASPDFTSGPLNTPQTKKILLNDTPSLGASFASSTVRLCDAGESPFRCSVNSTGSVKVKNIGTYKIDSSGVITFTPVKDYAGTPAPLNYQVKDSTGQWASSQYTPTIKPPSGPKATPQRLFVAPGDAVSFTKVVGSGGLGSGTGLKTGAAGGPCFVTVVNSVSSCVTTLRVDGEGTWSINQKTGVASFVALSTLPEGRDASAVVYRITDKWGQTADSTLTPYTQRGPELPDTGGSASNATQLSVVMVLVGLLLRRRWQSRKVGSSG